MADSAASVTSAAPVNPPASATTGDNALGNNPFADTQSSKPSEPASSAVTEPLSVTPDVHKQADTSAATTNGDAAASANNDTALNGTAEKLESLVPEQPKQAQAAAPTSVASTAAAPTETSASTAADETPALLNGATKDTEAKNGAGAPSTDAKDSEHAKANDAENANGAAVGVSTSTAAPGALGALSTSADKSDVEMKGANAAPEVSGKPASGAATTAPAVDPTLPSEKTAKPAPTPAGGADVPVAAPAIDITGSASTTGAPAVATTGSNVEATAGDESATQKRKAEADTDGALDTEEPSPKKQKGPLAKAMDKAKDVVDDVKTKAANKGSKKTKKEAVPVGRTERKTRSQGRAD